MMSKILRAKGLDLQRIVITEEDFDKLINRFYEEDKQRQKEKKS